MIDLMELSCTDINITTENFVTNSVFNGLLTDQMVFQYVSQYEAFTNVGVKRFVGCSWAFFPLCAIVEGSGVC